MLRRSAVLDGYVSVCDGPQGNWATMTAVPVPVARTVPGGVCSMAKTPWRRAAAVEVTKVGIS
jgi:hypothetical protein